MNIEDNDLTDNFYLYFTRNNNDTTCVKLYDKYMYKIRNSEITSSKLQILQFYLVLLFNTYLEL